MTLPVAILAGGLSTRLRPVTERIPKSLVEVGGKPFVDHQLRLLARNGIQRVVFCLGYLGEQVVDVVGDGARFGLDVRYVFDGDRLLGTAGAITRALSILGDEFFILYGDSYLDCDYQAVEAAFRSAQLPALMTVFANGGYWDNSNVEFDGQRIVGYSKANRTERMQHIDYGLGAAHRSIFDEVSTETPTDLASLYEDLVRRGEIAAYEVTRRFYEVGSFDGIAELDAYLKEHDAK